jgi:hypothetical protein
MPMRRASSVMPPAARIAWSSPWSRIQLCALCAMPVCLHIGHFVLFLEQFAQP